MVSKWENFQMHGGKTSGMPFVITAGGDRIYAGTFWWAYSSKMPPACAVNEAIQLTPHEKGGSPSSRTAGLSTKKEFPERSGRQDIIPFSGHRSLWGAPVSFVE
jgi:hypothetical protein